VQPPGGGYEALVALGASPGVRPEVIVALDCGRTAAYRPPCLGSLWSSAVSLAAVIVLLEGEVGSLVAGGGWPAAPTPRPWA